MMNQITTLRLKTGEEVAFVDWTDQPLFSTIEVLHGTTTQEMNFFQYTVGDQVPGFAPVAPTTRVATEMDTNLASAGGMASTEEFLVFAIRPEVYRRTVSSDSAPDFSAPVALANNSNEPAATALMLSVLNHRCMLGLEISDKVYAYAGFGYFNGGMGPVGSGVPGGALTGAVMSTPGVPSQEAVRAFSIPQHIGGQEKFRVFLQHLDDGTGNGIEIGQEGASEDGAPTVVTTRFARIRLYLDGLHKRPTS